MEDADAPASARIAAARTSLELAGDIGKHSQSQRDYEQNLAEMTPEELSAIIDRWEGEKLQLQRILHPSDKGYVYDLSYYRTYKNSVLSWPIKEAIPPPCHTQKSVNIVIIDR